MGTIAGYRELFRYDAWANRRLFEVFADMQIHHEVISTWSHHLLSQKLWLARIKDEAHDRLSLWTVLSVPESGALIQELERRWSHLLEDLSDPDLASLVRFQNTQGIDQADRLDDVLAHVTHHAAYHRGQITVRMSAVGFTPPATDLIVWARSKP